DPRQRGTGAFADGERPDRRVHAPDPSARPWRGSAIVRGRRPPRGSGTRRKQDDRNGRGDRDVPEPTSFVSSVAPTLTGTAPNSGPRSDPGPWVRRDRMTMWSVSGGS